MAIQGLRDTSNFVANARPQNYREGILLLYPNGKAPLVALTSLMKSRTVDDPVFNWWEKALDSQRVALGASLNAVAGTQNVTVVSGAKTLKEGDVLYVEQSGEQIFVTTDPGSDTVIQAQRGWAGTTPTAVTYNGAGINPNLLKMGNAYEQGSLAPTGISFDPSQKTNNTQIFRDTLEATRTAMKTRLRTGDAIKEAKRECLEYHSIGMERQFWLGKKSSTTKNGKPLTTMDGVNSFIPSANIKVATTDYGSGVTLAGLEEYMYNIFKFGSSEKVGFCGNRAALTIQQILRKGTGVQWNINLGVKEFGMNVMRITSPFGEIILKTHPLFNQVAGGATAGTDYYGMESWLFVLDMENITYVSFNGADTHYEPDLQANGMDGIKSGYLSESSIEVHHAQTHYLIKNLVASAAG